MLRGAVRFFILMKQLKNAERPHRLQGHSNSGLSRRRGLEQTRQPGPGDVVFRTDSMQRRSKP